MTPFSLRKWKKRLMRSGRSLNLVNKSVCEYEPSAQHDQSKAAHEMGISEQSPESYHNCFLTEGADNKLRTRLPECCWKPCFMLL